MPCVSFLFLHVSYHSLTLFRPLTLTEKVFVAVTEPREPDKILLGVNCFLLPLWAGSQVLVAVARGLPYCKETERMHMWACCNIHAHILCVS